MSKAKEIIKRIEEVVFISEKTVVNPQDKKRMLQLVKDYGKVIYKGKLYSGVIPSGTGKFIRVSDAEDIDADTIKSYEIDSDKKAIALK